MNNLLYMKAPAPHLKYHVHFVSCFFQLILALRYLHKEKGIVHRDLTPSNIMLGENDKVTISKQDHICFILSCLYSTDNFE